MKRQVKKICTLVLGVALALSLSACKCSVEKAAVSQVEASHNLISAKLLQYVAADPKLDAKGKADWKALVDSDQENINALKKAMEK